MIRELQGEVGACPGDPAAALRTAKIMDDLLEGYYGGREGEFWEREGSWPGAAKSKSID